MICLKVYDVLTSWCSSTHGLTSTRRLADEGNRERIVDPSNSRICRAHSLYSTDGCGSGLLDLTPVGATSLVLSASAFRSAASFLLMILSSSTRLRIRARSSLFSCCSLFSAVAYCLSLSGTPGVSVLGWGLGSSFCFPLSVFLVCLTGASRPELASVVVMDPASWSVIGAVKEWSPCNGPSCGNSVKGAAVVELVFCTCVDTGADTDWLEVASDFNRISIRFRNSSFLRPGEKYSFSSPLL